jgi:hypothetical protein
MIPLLDLVLLPLPFWLLAGLAFDVARRTAGDHRPLLATVAVLRALMALLASVMLLGGADRSTLPILGLLVAGTTITCATALRLLWARGAQSSRSPSEGAAGSGRMLVRAWWWLAAMDLAALLPALASGHWAWLLGVPVLLGVPFGFALAMRRLARASWGKKKRAFLARVTSHFCAVLPFLFVVMVSARQIEATLFLTAAFYAMAILVPLYSLCLEGLRLPTTVPMPDSPDVTLVDLARHRRRAFFLLGLAVVSLAWACLHHLDRCAGELVKVDSPPNHWRTLPIIAELFRSGRDALGPFHFRGYTEASCHYRRTSIVHYGPNDHREKALHDPDLCFSGTVSLEDSFPTWGWDDLALRHDPASDVYVVSGMERGRGYFRAQQRPSAPEPMVAFRRDLGPRWRFDLPSSAWFVAAAVLSLAMAAGLGWRVQHRARLDSNLSGAVKLASWQVRLLLLSAALPWGLEAYRQIYDVPSPGHEIRSRPSMVE